MPHHGEKAKVLQKKKKKIETKTSADTSKYPAIVYIST